MATSGTRRALPAEGYGRDCDYDWAGAEAELKRAIEHFGVWRPDPFVKYPIPETHPQRGPHTVG